MGTLERHSHGLKFMTYEGDGEAVSPAMHYSADRDQIK
jgi:hypothetical protein